MVSKNTLAALLVSIWQDYKAHLIRQHGPEGSVITLHMGMDEFVKWLETYDQAKQESP